MTHRYLCRILLPDSDPVRKHIMLALLQADHDKQREVVFGKLCSTCEPLFHWPAESGICSLALPTGVSGAQVGQTLTSLLGFDSVGKFPRQAELTVQAGNARSDWVVTLSAPEDQIVLKRI